MIEEQSGLGVRQLRHLARELLSDSIRVRRDVHVRPFHVSRGPDQAIFHEVTDGRTKP